MCAHFHDQDDAGQRFSNGPDPNHLKVQTKNDKRTKLTLRRIFKYALSAKPSIVSKYAF